MTCAALSDLQGDHARRRRSCCGDRADQQVDKPGRAKLIRKMKAAEKLARQKKVQG